MTRIRLLAAKAGEAQPAGKSALAAIELGRVPAAVLGKDRVQALVRWRHCPVADVATLTDLAQRHHRHRGLVRRCGSRGEAAHRQQRQRNESKEEELFSKRPGRAHMSPRLMT
jgi:hypothetical protein